MEVFGTLQNFLPHNIRVIPLHITGQYIHHHHRPLGVPVPDHAAGRCCINLRIIAHIDIRVRDLLGKRPGDGQSFLIAENVLFLHQIPQQHDIMPHVMIRRGQRLGEIPETFRIDLFQRRHIGRLGMESQTDKFPGVFGIAGTVIIFQIPGKRIPAVPGESAAHPGFIFRGGNICGQSRMDLDINYRPQRFTGTGNQPVRGSRDPGIITAPHDDIVHFIPERIVNSPQFIAAFAGINHICECKKPAVKMFNNFIGIPIPQQDLVSGNFGCGRHDRRTAARGFINGIRKAGGILTVTPIGKDRHLLQGRTQAHIFQFVDRRYIAQLGISFHRRGFLQHFQFE